VHQETLVLVTVDAPGGSSARDRSERKRALDVVRDRLAAGLWPIHKRTKHQGKMVPGTRLLFYLGGTGKLSKHIVAEAIVLGVRPGSTFPRRLYSTDDAQTPAIVLELGNPRELSFPINLFELREQISFLRRAGKHWGLRMQGGCIAMQPEDIEVIGSIK
jgi:hypothetical protein